jgi:hypothetical protein
VTDVSSTPGEPDSAAGTGIDTTVSHSARIWDYWLRGKDNYAVDREVGDRIEEMLPDIVRQAREDRLFLGRVVRYLAGEAGIRQFLDIGTGLPTANNTHQVAQAIAPESRVVYVDNDPLVLVHARALLTSTLQGACDYVEADIREPDKILAEAARTLDFTRPAAITMLGILGQIADSDHPEAIIKRLLDAVPSGSYLAISDGVDTSAAFNEASRRMSEMSRGSYHYHLRSPEQITGFFAGLEMVEPGIVTLGRWRPEATPFVERDEVPGLCGVGRKP